MKKIFIFISLLLSLSGNVSNKLEVTLSHITQALEKLNESTLPIKFSSSFNHSIVNKAWTCDNVIEFLRAINVSLHAADEHSRSFHSTLKSIKENVKAVMDFCLQGQIMTGETRCRSRSCKKNPLECYITILKCLNRTCTATSVQSFSKEKCSKGTCLPCTQTPAS